MPNEMYSTPAIWLGALLLSETDARLVKVQVSQSGRATVMFSFYGDNLSRVAETYCKNKAIANVSGLRSRLNFLRDFIFQARMS